MKKQSASARKQAMDNEAMVRNHIAATCEVYPIAPPIEDLYQFDNAPWRKATWYAISWQDEYRVGASRMVAVLDGKIVFDGLVGE